MDILLVPSEQGGLGKSKGSAKAPEQLIKLFDKPFKIINVMPSNLEETNKNIYEEVLTKEKAVIIGGDHSITYPAFKAFIQNNPGAGLIIFDAHPDCVNNFNPPTHEDFVRVLIEEGTLDPKKLILVGVRQSDMIEKEFLNNYKIRCFTMDKIFEYGVKDICETIMETANSWPTIYLSLDIDVVDPAFAPGTGYREPGGLDPKELFYCLKRLKKLKNLKMVDLVEISPEKDHNNLTVKLGEKILKELI